MSFWDDEVEASAVLNYLTEFFDYDHFEGRLRWTGDKTQIDRLPLQMRRQVLPGAIAGTTCRPGYDYEIKVDGRLRNALRLIWEHQTGICRSVMTIQPGEDRFRIDNLCLLPYGKRRAPKQRGKGLQVVSWSYERKQFTVVSVDDYYNKTVLSYHDIVDDAIDASRKPIVSFL